MELALWVWGVVSLAELLLWTPLLWRWHRRLAPLLMIALAGATGLVLLEEVAWWTAVVALFSLYRLVNLGRLAADRIHQDYLFHTSRRTVLWLMGLQLLTLLVAKGAANLSVTGQEWIYGLVITQLAGALVLWTSTRRHLRTTLPPAVTHPVPEQDLPSLTVAIPARNETDDLAACLRSLVASTYPKLEILVLDDCSQNRRTPEIIREFAHDGVRFMAGSPPPGQWLAKNHAYAQLARQANGELLLFCGVDSRFQPGSLTALVQTMLHKQKQMISLLPRNAAPDKSWNPRPVLLQPNRYAWEIALPRRLLRRPPVLSTCWLINRQALHAAGGFAAVSRKAVPESYFAKAIANHQDGYSFMQSNAAIGVHSQKSSAAQSATAIRTRYPQLHRRPELVALVAIAEFFVLCGPLIIVVMSLLLQVWLLAALAGLAAVLVLIVHSRIVNLTYRRFLLRGTWLLPLAALYDIALLHYSMWQYEFREVIWKGRNVCLPVMRTIPRLPPLNH